MIANYGYKDGSGEYFISINTDKCAQCKMKPCVEACPEKVLEVFKNDYDDEVVGVNEEHRNKIKYTCAPCKPVKGKQNTACIITCPYEAIKHSW